MKKVTFYSLLLFNAYVQSSDTLIKVLQPREQREKTRECREKKIKQSIEVRIKLKDILAKVPEAYFKDVELKEKYKKRFNKLKISAKPFIDEIDYLTSGLAIGCLERIARIFYEDLSEKKSREVFQKIFIESYLFNEVIEKTMSLGFDMTEELAKKAEERINKKRE